MVEQFWFKRAHWTDIDFDHFKTQTMETLTIWSLLSLSRYTKTAAKVKNYLMRRPESSRYISTDLQMIFWLTAGRNRAAFVEALVSPKTINAKAVSTIYSSSHFSIIEEIIGKLESSSSVYQFLAVFQKNMISLKKTSCRWCNEDLDRFKWLTSVLL